MKVRRIIRITYFAMLSVIGALAAYKAEPLPVTLQAFFAVLSGLVLGGTDGAISQTLYVAVGLLGLPVFAFGGGYKYAIEPTFGYLVGMIVGAYASGIILRRFKTIKFVTVLTSGLVGLVPVYVLGAAYQLIIFTSFYGYAFSDAFATLCLLPVSFAVQAVLIVLVAIIYPKAMTMIGSINKEEFKDNGVAV